jgi:hypothetical protein
MDDLIAFLRARLDDDEMDVDMMVATSSDRWLAEVAAKRAVVECHRPQLTIVEWPHDQTGKGEALTCPSCRPAEPTEWHPPQGQAGVLPDGFVASYVLAPCPTLRHLAAVYADHPDYRAEWRPVADQTAQE